MALGGLPENPGIVGDNLRAIVGLQVTG